MNAGAIHDAVEVGDIARELIEGGAHVDVIDRGVTTLHIASNKANIPMVQLLVESGANTTSGRQGRTALWWANVRFVVDTDGIPVVEWLLLQRGADIAIGDLWRAYENCTLPGDDMAGWTTLLRIAVI